MITMLAASPEAPPKTAPTPAPTKPETQPPAPVPQPFTHPDHAPDPERTPFSPTCPVYPRGELELSDLTQWNIKRTES